MLSDQVNSTANQRQKVTWWENIRKRKPLIFCVAAVGLVVSIAVIYYLSTYESKATRCGKTNDDTTPLSPHSADVSAQY